MSQDDPRKFVVGFLITTDRRHVLLVRKNRPEWQSGMLNGVGGKVRTDELFHQAMRREFMEEAGLHMEWREFCRLTGSYGEVRFFYSIAGHNETQLVRSATDEKISWHRTGRLPANVVPNLRWLIPMALSPDHGEKCRRFHIREDA